MKKIKFLALTMSALLSVNFVWGAEVTDIINIVGYNNSTTTSNTYICGQDDADTSEGGIAVAACNYAGNGATRGNKTAIGPTSSCNFHIYNTEAYPGAITKIEISATGTPTTQSGVTTYGRYQNKLYASMGTSSQGSVSAVQDAIAGNLTQGSSSKADVSKFTWTFNASNNYTYFKLLTNEKFVSGAMKGAQITVTYVTGPSCTAPTITSDLLETEVVYTKNATATALSITATGTDVTYQWYSNTSKSTSGATTLTDQTNASYTPPTNATGTTYYYCVASSSTCTTTSTIAKITVTAPTRYVTFLNNGQPISGTGIDGQGRKQYHEGDQLGDLPTLTSAEACDATSTTFMGWYNGDAITTKQSTPPTFVTYETLVNGDMTLRAVWAKEQ